ncbi:MAG: elongation factor G [Pirellulales bacterium]|nr:elongation factor G [Pirellulales bacterium]
MPRKLENLRNIGIIAHIDAGKTTLTERMLFYAGATHRMGNVDQGTTETDFDPEEQQRGITIYSAAVTFDWKDCHVNLIDTPGHVDFTAEVERSLRVLDGGVVVFSAREGVEAQSETVWRQADRYKVPRAAFINKMDREGADFYRTLDEIHERLGDAATPLQIPLGAGPEHVQNPFRGVIDLVKMKLLTFDSKAQGAKVTESEIPDEASDVAGEWRGKLLDKLSMFNDEMTELMLSDEEVPERLIHRVVRDATIHSMLVPVLCGSALDFQGVQPVLDAVSLYLPSPADMPPVEGTNPRDKDAAVTRKPDPDEPFCGLVFKIVADKHGDLHYVRVYSGVLKANSRVYNAGKDKKENVPQLWHIQADSREQVESASAGDIVGVIGLRHSVTGDTLCDTKSPIVLESIVFPETVISMAIEPESTAERKKLADVLEMMKRQDPTFRAVENEETGQTLISGMGELHLEVIKHKLLRDFNLDVKVHNPRVSYRETVDKKTEVTGHCHRQISGQTATAAVTIRIEPFTLGRNLVTVLDASEGLPEEFRSAIFEVLSEQTSGAYGFPLLNVKITLVGGEVHDTESTAIAFQIAAHDAFNKALDAGTAILEPIMKVEISTPEEHMGDFVSDINQRRGIITQTDSKATQSLLEAEIPLSELFGYSSTMRSLSQGRATCTMEPKHYGPAPPEVADRFS